MKVSPIEPVLIRKQTQQRDKNRKRLIVSLERGRNPGTLQLIRRSQVVPCSLMRMMLNVDAVCVVAICTLDVQGSRAMCCAAPRLRG